MFTNYLFFFWSEFVDYFLGFFFVWVRYSSGGADVFAASAENDAVVRVNGDLFFAVYVFHFEGFLVAEVDAFAACYAFGGVDFWVPGD